MLSVIIKKELKRVFTDRRLVFTSFILPALSIFIIYSIMGSLINNMSNDMEKHKSIVYIQNAPDNFKKFLSTTDYNNQIKINYIDLNSDVSSIKKSITGGNIDLLVTFEKDFYAKVLNYKNLASVPQIKTYYNSNKDYSQYARNNIFISLLSKYEDTLLGERLTNIKYANVFDIDKTNKSVDLADKKKVTGKELSILVPMLLAILLFAGAMGTGMDSIAGEKERGTMATMLVTPVKRETIALGKIISLSIIAFISAASSFIGIIASFPFSSSMFSGGSNINITSLKFSNFQLLQLLLILIVLVLIYVCLICLFSISAKSVKEAGSYISPLYMLVMVCAFMNAFSHSTPETWKFALPIYGNVAALKSLFMFELTTQQFLLTIISSIIVAILLINIIAKKFNDEKVMFSA